LLTSGEYWDRWFNTYENLVDRLHTSQHTVYWEQWFNTYSQRIAILLQTQKLQALGAEP
jgi:hypothetical protein